MSLILGLHYGHHGTACLVRDGKILVALSHDRLRKTKTGLFLGKYCHGVSDDLIDCLFEYAGVDIGDIDYIALSDWNKRWAFHDITVTEDGKEVKDLWNTIYDIECRNLVVNLRKRKIPAFHIGHQLGHAAVAYYTSPFDESYCLTMDASGANYKNNSLVSYGNGKELKSLYCPGLNVGVAYSFFTQYLGIGHQLFKAGATMALAGYGQVLQKVSENLVKYVKESFREDPSYVAWYDLLWRDLSGSPKYFDRKESDSEKARNIAATIQHIFQYAVLKCVQDIESNSVKNLCLGGGSMLNCTSNSFLMKHGQFENIHLFPGCGDDGLCVGTALYYAHHVLGEERHKYKDGEICYLGPDRPSKEDPDYEFLAESLAEGKIVAWCNGRSEFGPRALGNRSILADPRLYKNRERINFEIKNREWYRPLSPVILEEHTKDWFHFTKKSPFMLFTAEMIDRESIPAASHVDFSARIQTVNKEDNPLYYRLIEEFYNITGVPILLNTSLNGNGEPIVETDEHAMDFFEKSKVDLLVLDGEIWE